MYVVRSIYTRKPGLWRCMGWPLHKHCHPEENGTLGLFLGWLVFGSFFLSSSSVCCNTPPIPSPLHTHIYTHTHTSFSSRSLSSYSYIPIPPAFSFFSLPFTSFYFYFWVWTTPNNSNNTYTPISSLFLCCLVLITNTAQKPHHSSLTAPSHVSTTTFSCITGRGGRRTRQSDDK